ncbi:hypothetical protein [Serratia fonticola]|uniref:Uncharacterized protein n=1 Tax=Serratia fonticola TaxID=47917 RepID=A0AAW3WP45_SERFO|nr:hypothetical protein [Serratia fonticola]MBC3211407.1 hypothetical protein [Serratia fonticola]NYA12390.1 hypothetical protein [Serratia fonticola]NYA31969.1 hypothetical protein [Serratia fonticola]
MSREITLEQASEKAMQAETVLALMESYPHQLEDSEVSALATLLRSLIGTTCIWMNEEQAQRRNKACN